MPAVPWGIIHEPSSVHPTVRLGEGSVIWRFCTIMEGVVIGRDCNIAACCEIARRCVLGDRVRMYPGAALPDDAVIGNDVYIGPNVVLVNVRYPMIGTTEGMFEPPQVHDGASIGANAVISAGVIVGRGAMVGAGAVVTRNVPPYTLVYGNPARVRRHAVNEAGETFFEDGVVVVWDAQPN